MLWLALQFVRLALDTRPGAEARETALAIVEARGPRRVVVAANAQARAAGVRPGQAPAAAQALCAGLDTELRRPADEHAAMDSLALWALGYSSLVARHGESMLLIEIGASRALFGSERRLLQGIADDLEQAGYACVAGLACTPAAARLFARAGHSRIVREATALREHIAALALDHGDLPAATCEALAAVGVRHYGALLRLPRAELARRFGQAVPDHLDALLGRQPETIRPMRIAPRFEQRLEWPYAISSSIALMFPAQRLVQAAAHWLLARQRAALRLRLIFSHEDHPDSVVDIGLGQATADRAHLLAVVRARLERLALPQGSTALRLILLETPPLSAPSRDLFARQGEAPEDALQLLDRLQGRLGEDAIGGYALQQDHRPERALRQQEGTTIVTRPHSGRHDKAVQTPGISSATRRGPAPAAAAAAATPQRPLFLLAQPTPVGHWPGFDWRQAQLSLPERIESGWWDEADATRDYYRLDQRDGQRLWIFRHRQPPHDWFVQGVYA